MCLITKDKEFRVAKKSIPCYVVRKVISKGISSPFRAYPWELGKEEQENTNLHGKLKTKCRKVYGKGLFHSFIHKKDAIKLAENLSEWSIKYTSLSTKEVFKAHIPRGIKYFKGEAYLVSYFTDNRPVYGSRKLVLIKRLTYGGVECKKKQ